LPFSNASGDPNAEYLSDGLTEGVIDKLAGLPNLKVISRTSAFWYKQRDIDPQKVAKELGVEALVVGRVIQRGDDLESVPQQPRRISQQQMHHAGIFMTQRYRAAAALLLAKAITASCSSEAAICPITVER